LTGRGCLPRIRGLYRSLPPGGVPWNSGFQDTGPPPRGGGPGCLGSSPAAAGRRAVGRRSGFSASVSTLPV